MTTLQQRLDQGDIIILDAGMGTELERRGVPMSGAAWCGEAVNTHPQVIRQIHEDYIRAGADIITTNTFSTAKHVLAAAGLGAQYRELNAQCVALAREARDAVADRPVLIGGSMSTFNPLNDKDLKPSAAEAKANYQEQAEVLAEAGIDLFLMEMVREIEHAILAIEAMQATGLPVWVGFSCRLAEDGSVLLFDRETLFAAGLEAILPLCSGSVVSIMHTDIEESEPALQMLSQAWDGVKGAYPHSGDFIMPAWQFDTVILPEAYAARAQQWVADGYQVIGGCCGMGPEHVRVLRETLPARQG